MTRFLFAVALASSLGIFLASCATKPDTTRNYQVACLSLKAAHQGFQLFAKARPGTLSADDMSFEGYVYAGVESLCLPPYDLSSPEAVIFKILSAAEAITNKLTQVNT